MAWNLPSLPTAGTTIATVANWATKVIDSLRYLKGLDGEIVLDDYPDFPSTAQGDIFYHDGTKLARLAAGTSSYVLTTQGAAANPAWTTGSPQMKLKTANEDVTNSDVLQNDDELVKAVGINEIWEFMVWLKSSSTVNYDGIKATFVVPTGGTLTYITSGLIGASSATVAITAIAAAATFNMTINIEGKMIMLHGLYIGGANAGNVQFQWAQNTAIAGETLTVLANSFLIAHKLA